LENHFLSSERKYSGCWVAEADFLEEVVKNLEKDVSEWNQLKQQDLTHMVEAELDCLAEQTEKNYLETFQEVAAISQEFKSLEARDAEAIEVMSISSEAFDSAKDQIKKAWEMIAKANLLLSKTEPECQAETIRLEKIKAERLQIQ